MEGDDRICLGGKVMSQENEQLWRACRCGAEMLGWIIILATMAHSLMSMLA